MKYILNENIALRSWWLVPYAYYIKNSETANGLSEDEFNLLLQCDGEHDIEHNELIDTLIDKWLISEAKPGQVLTEWQKHKNCDNRYFPKINWMITGKCNYNCLHCFNAADNAPLMAEWSLEDANKLLDSACECGINAFTLTGGEPMLHKNFFDIVEGIYKRGMYLNELNTNGHFITTETLGRFKEIGCNPLIKISLDGLTHHDWLRNKKGAEKTALNAIKLSLEMGFDVKVQTNVHKGNIDTLLPTAKLLNEMGVSQMRIIRTSEAPRWVQNAGDACLSFEEYFDSMTEFSRDYLQAGCEMDVDIWQFITLLPYMQGYAFRAVAYNENTYRASKPVCPGNRGMVAISADGGVNPCNQMSGFYAMKGWHLGNVKEDGLKPLLQSGDYLNEVCTTLGDLRKENSKCDNCKYFVYCAGGCRAIGVALTNEKMGSDLSKCAFFENEYYKKVESILSSYRNLTPIDPKL